MSDPMYRRATRDDIGAIVDMLADDALGATRESTGDLTPYESAFAHIDADPYQILAVCEIDGRVVGTLQITITHGLSRRAATRATIEAVRVHRDMRGSGLGTAMLQWAIDQARARGCGMVQLTTDATLTEAHHFYEHLGFEPTHIGFKMKL